MRVESVEITNFKVLRHLKIDNVPDLVVIAGPNGSGKTALFDALRVFKEAIATYSVRNQGPIYVHGLLQQIGPVIAADEAEAKITVSIKLSDAEKQAIELPEESSNVLGPPDLARSGGPNLQEQAVLTHSFTENSDIGPGYLRQLLGGYRSGGELGVIDHIDPDRSFAAAEVTSINFSVENEEQELQRLVYNSRDKFVNLTQDLVMMRFLDMQEKEQGIEEPHTKKYPGRFKHFTMSFLSWL